MQTISMRKTRIAQTQKPHKPVRPQEQKPALQHDQLPVQAAVSQVADRRAEVSGNGLRPAVLLTMQRMTGNRLVTRLLTSASRAARPAVQPKIFTPHDVLQPQHTIPNRASGSQLTPGAPLNMLQRDSTKGDAKQASTQPRMVNIAINPSDVVAFQTPGVAVGGLQVYVTGRMTINGKASLIGEELPKKGSDKFLKTRVRELVVAAFKAAKPAGDAAEITVDLGGEALALKLAAGAERAPAFQVSGHFTAAKRDLAVPGCEITGAKVMLDATFWIAPVKPPTPAPGQTPDTPGDRSIESMSFAGTQAQFGGSARSGGVTLKSNMDAFDAKLPAFVRSHRYLQLFEQRAAFFQEMRAYFGTDDKTVAHFADMRPAKVKGATTWLHNEAATRLEAVQAELGADNMPTSGGVGWPRAECKLSGKQGIGNLHNLGFAVDYNAYQTPMLTDRRILDLVQIVTGHSASMQDVTPKGLDTRVVGRTFTYGTEEEKQALESDPKIQKWLEAVGAEALGLSKASEDIRASLKGTDDAGAQIDLAPRLQELRQKWFAAITPAEQQAVTAELPVVLKPWLTKIGAQQKAMTDKITAAGLDPGALPSDKKLEIAVNAAQGLKRRVTALRAKLGATLKKGQRRQVDKLIVEARKLLDEIGEAPAADAVAVAELDRLNGLVEKRKTTLGQKKWLDRVNALYTALTGDPSLVFGASASKEVKNPALAQIVDTGFFNLKGKAKAGKEAFDVDFVKSMAKHGFTHGATWSTPDSMHFELRWRGLEST